MNDDEIIEEIIADLAAGLIDASDEEISATLDSYDLSEEDKEDILETIQQVREAGGLADENIDPINIDSVDAMADAHAQQMADEDNTEVTMLEEDKDSDGDIDKVEINKTGASSVDPEMLKALQDLVNGSEDEGNSDEDDDNPHDTVLSDERVKNIIGTLATFKY